jgi:hypothetical protein
MIRYIKCDHYTCGLSHSVGMSDAQVVAHTAAKFADYGPCPRCGRRGYLRFVRPDENPAARGAVLS